MQSLTVNNSDIQHEPTLSGINPHSAVVQYAQISKLTLLLFCGYVITWYLQIGYRIPLLGTIRFEFFYAAVLTVIAIVSIPKINTGCPMFIYVALYLIVLLVQIPFSFDFDMSWNVFVNRIIKFAFLSFFIIAFVRSPIHLKYFMGAFLLACLKMGQEGLVGRISGDLMWESQGIMRLHGTTPLYTHPNSYAGMAIGTLPFVYYLWPLSNRYIKCVLFMTGILSINILIFTGSRTGYIGLCALVFYVFITAKKKLKFSIISLLVIMCSLPFIPNDYVERFLSAFTGEDKEGYSINTRKEILKDAWQIFKEHPLGVGISAFPKARMETFGRVQDTHNLYLEIATNLGIQGLLVVYLLIYNLLMTLKQIRTWAQLSIVQLLPIRDISIQKIVYDLKLVESVALATSLFVIIRLVLGLFGMDLYEIYWWFAIGITISLYSIINNILNSLNIKDKLCH